MPEVSSFKIIREISYDHENPECKELDAFLKAGWTLVDIHQRDYLDPQSNEPSRITVYIVGHTDAEAVPPKWDDPL